MKNFLSLKPKTKRCLEIIGSGMCAIIAIVAAIALIIFAKDFNRILAEKVELQKYNDELIALIVVGLVVNIVIIILSLLVMFLQPKNTATAYKPRKGLIIPTFILSFILAILYFRALWYLGLITVLGSALLLVDLIAGFDERQ